MAAGKYSFTIDQGSTLNLEVQYKDSTGTPVNLSGYSAKMQIKSGYADNSPTTYITLSSSLASDNTGLNLSGSNGTTPLASGSIGIYISATSSSAFTFTDAIYDLELRTGDTVNRILEGQVKVRKEVTR
jgi:hypothetical protein